MQGEKNCKRTGKLGARRPPRTWTDDLIKAATHIELWTSTSVADLKMVNKKWRCYFFFAL